MLLAFWNCSKLGSSIYIGIASLLTPLSDGTSVDGIVILSFTIICVSHRLRLAVFSHGEQAITSATTSIHGNYSSSFSV